MNTMTRWSRRMALACCGGVMFGIIPGCVEIAILQWAAPFLLSA